MQPVRERFVKGLEADEPLHVAKVVGAIAPYSAGKLETDERFEGGVSDSIRFHKGCGVRRRIDDWAVLGAGVLAVACAGALLLARPRPATAHAEPEMSR